jgi:hypothetical protein
LTVVKPIQSEPNAIPQAAASVTDFRPWSNRTNVDAAITTAPPMTMNTAAWLNQPGSADRSSSVKGILEKWISENGTIVAHLGR